MKTLLLMAVAGLCFFSAAPAWAQDLTPPKVAKPLPDITVSAGKSQTVIDLTNKFALTDVKQEVVRFKTTLGNIDVELYPGSTPKTVANFLSYVDRGAASKGGYNDSVIQRVIPGFVVQGGSYYFQTDGPEVIDEQAAIPSEAGISNTTGTIAMALSTGPDSAQSAWFFNLADNNGSSSNPDLDTSLDGGPFTVFGRVIEADLATLDAIAALRIEDLSAELGGNFENLPVYDYTPGESVSLANLVYLRSVALIPLIPTAPGVESVLTLSASSKKPDLVTASISGHKLKLVYKPGKTGTATIKVSAKDSAGSSVTSHFTVTIK